MHMIKVPGTFHDGEIQSIDVSPCNKYVVTGGKDGKCNIWDRSQLAQKSKLTTPSAEDFENLKPIQELDICKGSSITCLRFGNLLEEGDHLLISFESGQVYKVTIPETFGSTVETPRLLFEHTNPIVEITCSHDGEIVAFATYENEILIYDLRFDEIIDNLNIHLEKSAIKGLKFDNSHGKWLCSLGDDKWIKILHYDLIWNSKPELTTKRTFKYEIQQKISKLITQNFLNNNSRVRRIDFSKDDKLISVPNSNKGKMSLVSVLCNTQLTLQSQWKSWCAFVGHSFNCEVTKFSPNVYINKKPNTTADSDDPLKFKSYYIIATAGSDKTLAIWNTSVDAPIIVLQDLTTSTILDICWSRDGLALFITSLKGELLVVSFDDEELGKIRPQLEPIKNSKDWKTELESRFREQANVISTTPTITADPKLQEQRVITKNGKKRVLPMLLSSSGPETTVHRSATESTSISTNGLRPGSMEFDPPSYAVLKNVALQLKRKKISQLEEDLALARKKLKKELQPIEFVGSVVINPSSSFSNVRLSIPKIRRTWEHHSPNDDLLYISVRNGNGNESGPSKIQLFKKNQLSANSEDSEKEIFCDFVPRRILLTSGGEGLFWALLTVEGTIIVYSDSGKRILPPIVLGTPVSFLESKNDYLMAITCLGEMYAWNIKTKKLVFEPTSLFPLLQPLIKPSLNKPQNGEDDPTDAQQQEQELYENDLLARLENLTLCSITSKGIPIVTLSNGNGYIYDSDMCSWSLVSDSWWAFGSQYWDNTLIGSRSNEAQNIISMLEKHTNEEIIRKGKNKFFNKISKIMLMKEGFENLENIISINHLENKILIYKYLNDYKNFKYFLIVYVKKLIEMNLTNRIYDVILNLKESDPCDDDLIREIVMLNPKLNDFVNSI